MKPLWLALSHSSVCTVSAGVECKCAWNVCVYVIQLHEKSSFFFLFFALRFVTALRFIPSQTRPTSGTGVPRAGQRTGYLHQYQNRSQWFHAKKKNKQKKAVIPNPPNYNYKMPQVIHQLYHYGNTVTTLSLFTSPNLLTVWLGIPSNWRQGNTTPCRMPITYTWGLKERGVQRITATGF